MFCWRSYKELQEFCRRSCKQHCSWKHHFQLVSWREARTQSAPAKVGLAVLVTMARARFWWSLNSRREQLKWTDSDGSGQVREDLSEKSGTRGRDGKSVNTAAHTDTVPQVLRSLPSSAVSTPGWKHHKFPPPGSQDIQPPLSPATTWIQKAVMYIADLQSQPTWHTVSQHTFKRQPHLLQKCWGDVGHEDFMDCH